MNLTKKETGMLLYCIDLIIQNYGRNEELERIYEKLFVYMKGLEHDKD